MPKFRLLQNSFIAGEWSPRMAGRTDLERYPHAASEITNAIVMKQGGVRRRDGTKYTGTVHDSARRTRVIPFTREDTGDWVIELGHNTARFYNEGVLWAPAGVLVLATPWSETEIWNLQIQQVTNIIPNTPAPSLYCVGSGTAPVCRFIYDPTSAAHWTLSPVAWWNGPYLPINTTATTLTPSATTGTITITASAATFVTGTTAGHAPSASYGIGALFALTTAGTTGWVRITAVASTTSATALVIVTLGGTGATSTWYEGSWSNYRGWPRTVTLHQQRLVLGGSTNQNNTLWGSQTSDLENMDAGTALANQAWMFTLSGCRDIRWLRGGDDALRVGARNRVVQLQVPSGEVIEPANLPSETVQSNFGAERLTPVQAHNALLFIQTGARQIREVTFVNDSQSYNAVDLMALADHLTTTYGIVEMVFQQEPDPILWCVRSDGVLLGMTYERPSDVVAWHTHETGAAAHLFESICRIRNAANVERVVMVVKRGSSRFVEYFEPDFNDRALNVDCAVTYTGAAASSVSGLTHLNGLTVDIVGSGGGVYVAYAQQVVSAGAVTGLSPQVTVAEVGLHFDTTVATMKPELRLADGTLQHRLKRITKAIVRLFDTGPGATVNGEVPEERDM